MQLSSPCLAFYPTEKTAALCCDVTFYLAINKDNWKVAAHSGRVTTLFVIFQAPTLFHNLGSRFARIILRRQLILPPHCLWPSPRGRADANKQRTFRSSQPRRLQCQRRTWLWQQQPTKKSHCVFGWLSWLLVTRGEEVGGGFGYYIMLTKALTFLVIYQGS